MVPALSEDERSARGGARSSGPLFSPALGKGLRAMAREHPGLVHQPPDLVGAPDTGVVPESEVGGRRSEVRGRRSEVGDLCRAEGAAGSGELDSGSGYARYLVFVVALGLRDDG